MEWERKWNWNCRVWLSKFQNKNPLFGQMRKKRIEIGYLLFQRDKNDFHVPVPSLRSETLSMLAFAYYTSCPIGHIGYAYVCTYIVAKCMYICSNIAFGLRTLANISFPVPYYIGREEFWQNKIFNTICSPWVLCCQFANKFNIFYSELHNKYLLRMRNAEK